MKKILNKLIKGERGQALIIVMILLLVGTLIVTPLLAFMSTGLIVGKEVYEQRTAELYAADAGVEDAIYKILTDNLSLPEDLGDSWPYTMAENVNAKGVTVEIVKEDDGTMFLCNLLGEKPKPNQPHADWITVLQNPEEGVFTIIATYNGTAANKKVNGIGAWLEGTYLCTDNAAGDTLAPPLADITDDYPNYTFEVKPYGGGTAFIWEWTAADRPVFTKGETKTQTFRFAPEDSPSFSFAWVDGGSDDIWISGEVDLTVWKIIATASSTDKQTEAIAYVREHLNETKILTWEVNLQ